MSSGPVGEVELSICVRPMSSVDDVCRQIVFVQRAQRGGRR
jgi:hypothetical protein